MKKRPNYITAAELMKELENDPSYVKMVKEKEEKRRKRAEEFAKEEKLLIGDLGSIGIKVSSVWDLVNTKQNYSKALPVLLKHLKIDYRKEILEGIARALIIKEARGIAASSLIELFKKISSKEESFKWAVGYAVSQTADDLNIDEIIRLIKDETQGPTRGVLALSFRYINKEWVDDYLIKLTFSKELELVRNAVDVLGKRKTKMSVDRLIELTSHQDKEVSRLAKEALKRIIKKK